MPNHSPPIFEAGIARTFKAVAEVVRPRKVRTLTSPTASSAIPRATCIRGNRFGAILLFGLLFISSQIVSAPALADTPSADYIFPAGGQRGTKVAARVGATFLHGRAEFEIRGHGLKAPNQIEETDTIWFEGPMIFKPDSQRKEDYPRDHATSIEIDPKASAGVGYWRIRTSQGVTSSRPFVIGDLPEIVEQETEGRPEPQLVQLPVTINGRVFPREDVDIWSFDAVAGRSYRLSVMAADIQSPLDSHIQIHDPKGQLVAENDDYRGSDSALTYKAAVSGRHQVRLFDSSFRGLQNYVYRLTIHEAPHVESVFPLGARQGESTEFLLFGVGLNPSAATRIKLDHRVGSRYVPFCPPGCQAPSQIKLDIGNSPEWTEKDSPQGKNQIPQLASGACAINGRIMQADEQDVWRWQTEKGKQYSLTLLTESLGSPLLADIAIEDGNGKVIKQVAADPTRPSEPALKVAGAETPYLIRIRGRTHGRNHAYRLRCQESAQDFELRLDTDAVIAYRGQKANLKIQIARQGFAGEIELAVKGLPDDITLEGLKAPAKKNLATITLTASETARVRPIHVTIEGSAKIGDKLVVRKATWASPYSEQDRHDVLIGVSMPTPFALDGLAFETRYGARGTIFRRHFVVERNGFQGPLKLKLADRQIRHLQGVSAGIINLPAGASEIDFPIRVSPWLEMNRTSRTVVMAVGKVKDEQGVEHTVSFSSGAPKDQIVMLTAPCPISISVAQASLAAAPGETLELEFRVDRGVLRPHPVKVELLVADHIRGLIAQPVQLEATQSSGKIALQFDSNAGPFNSPVRLRATTSDGRDSVITETKFEIVAPLKE